MDRYVIIVAGGSGNRMEEATPKQFLLFANRPLLMHSISQFHAFDDKLRIIVVIHPTYEALWKQLCEQYHFQIHHQLIMGGETRYHSVRNGLESITGPGLIAVHDAARPLVSMQLIERCFSVASQLGNAIPAIPVTETLRWTDGEKVKTVDRSQFRLIQTPQVFHSDLLKKAYRQEYQPSFTDDASLIEALNLPIHLVEGDPENIKITIPSDLEIVEALLRRKK